MDPQDSQSNSPAPPPLPAQPQFPQQPAPQPQRLEDNAGMRMLMPIGQSGWAIAAGYFGLFSLILLPAPLAVILSVIAFIDIKRSKGTDRPKHGTGRAIFGFVAGMAGTGVLALIIGNSFDLF
ncbi:MAG: DUF4190 domain-containing protein [Verrucomicrobiota bacterium]